MKQEVFNIRLEYRTEEVTLTILPREKYYKVIYFGGVMGAVYCVAGKWNWIEAKDLEGGDLPMYIPDQKADRLELVPDKHVVNSIGREIELHINPSDNIYGNK